MPITRPGRTPLWVEIEKTKGVPIDDLIIKLYRKHGNQNEVAKELGISQPTLSNWMGRLGLAVIQTVVRIKDEKSA